MTRGDDKKRRLTHTAHQPSALIQHLIRNKQFIVCPLKSIGVGSSRKLYIGFYFMYKKSIRFQQSQPISQFFRDHLGLEDPQEIASKQDVMGWLWEKTKRKGIRFVLNGLSDYELAVLFESLLEEGRFDTSDEIFANDLIVNIDSDISFEIGQKNHVVEIIEKSYNLYRLK